MNADVYDMAHAQGALVGAVHPFDEVPDPFANPPERITDELPVDIALGKLDYMEIVGFSDQDRRQRFGTAAESWVSRSGGSGNGCHNGLCGANSWSSRNGPRLRFDSGRAGEGGCLDGCLEKRADICDERAADRIYAWRTTGWRVS